MISAARLAVFSSVLLTACSTVKNAAVTTFRVVDAPARYVRNRIDPPESTTTTTTTDTYGTSDVVNPGQPVNPPSEAAPSRQRRLATQERETTSNRATPTPRTQPAATPRKPSPTATPGVAKVPAQFPTARPVAGKPGFVYSIDPKGGIIDVTGYKTGDKAKDPYTQQIFVVP